MLHRDGRLAIAAAAELYRAILEDIEAHDYHVFARRAHVSGWGKLRRLPGIWWRTQNGYKVPFKLPPHTLGSGAVAGCSLTAYDERHKGALDL